MGTDIHVFQEKRVEGRWVSADEWEPGDEYRASYVPYERSLYYRRNYDLFACLAGVRNGRGFAGCVTGSPVRPISDGPKGMPIDASKEVQSCCEGWSTDAHSHSWLTADELLAYDWDSIRVNYGVIPLVDYLKWKVGDDADVEPSTFFGDVIGAGVLVYDESDIQAAVARSRATDFEVYVRAKWETPKRACAEKFLSVVVPRLRQLEAESEGARIVFWFDC